MQIIFKAQWFLERKCTLLLLFHKRKISLLNWARKIPGHRCSWIQFFKGGSIEELSLWVLLAHVWHRKCNDAFSKKGTGVSIQQELGMMKWLGTWGAGCISAFQHFLSCLLFPLHCQSRMLNGLNPPGAPVCLLASGGAGNPWCSFACRCNTQSLPPAYMAISPVCPPFPFIRTAVILDQGPA